MRTCFAPILLQIGGRDAQPDFYRLQLEVVEARAHRIFKHRILIAVFCPEPLLFGNKKIFLHCVSFLQQGLLPEVGRFEGLEFDMPTLWEMTRRIENTPRRDCQILMTTPQIDQVLALPDFKPYLPNILKGLDLEKLRLRSPSAPTPEPAPPVGRPPLMNREA